MWVASRVQQHENHYCGEFGIYQTELLGRTSWNVMHLESLPGVFDSDYRTRMPLMQLK